MADEDYRISGWEPDLDPGDTLCRRYLEHWAQVKEAFTASLGGRVERTDEFALTDSGGASGLFNAATLLQPPPARRLPGLLDAIESAFARGRGDVWLWSLWPTPDLRPRGWHLEGHPPLLARPPGPLPRPDGAPMTELVEVGDEAGLADWERAVVEGFPLEGLQPFTPGCLAGPALLADDRVRLWVGYHEGRPASASALAVAAGVAGLALAATVPAARRGGHWRSHARTRLAACPNRWAVGVFSDMSRPGAEQHGFVPIIRFTLWRRPRG